MGMDSRQQGSFVDSDYGQGIGVDMCASVHGVEVMPLRVGVAGPPWWVFGLMTVLSDAQRAERHGAGGRQWCI